jgi:hypothetical protein
MQSMFVSKREIFVFGSNLAGRHGKGAAAVALRHYGAIYGQGEGLQGNAYALPTKDTRLKTISLHNLVYHIETFARCASKYKDYDFLVTKIGCGLAGYRVDDIAPLFEYVKLDNVYLPQEFIDYLGRPSHKTSFDKNNVKVKGITHDASNS